MKGIIFNVARSAVESSFGHDGWDDVLDRAGLEGAYTSLGDYGHDELLTIAGVLPASAGETPAERLRWLGSACVPHLAAAFPSFFEVDSLTGFLPSLNHMIHPEVRKLYPGATPPDFEIDRTGDDLCLRYESDRELCHFAEGLVLGVADHLGEHVSVTQPVCMLRGADHCDLAISGASA